MKTKYSLSSEQQLDAFRDRVKYYFNLRQQLAASNRNDEDEIIRSTPVLGASRKFAKFTFKGANQLLPHKLLANPITSLFYKIGSKLLDKRIEQLKGEIKSPWLLIDPTLTPDSFELPVFESVTVSIIIPVHNKFDYTKRCIYSILKHSGTVTYEVIVADDASSDETLHIQELIKNTRINRNVPGLGFLKNCNAAAKLAKGEFVLLLNNDTVVQPGWLQPLVDLMNKDASIGMVGSKLVYPEGFLQEAGGIVWSDASGWNYGRMGFPDAPEYNYVKEVDYISGASIMLRTVLWNKLGGFDERYTPAYYEDSDLAFQIREQGLKVVYQPLSVVVHFEGISHGTDITTGIKEYQVKNKDTFYQKWKDVLANNHSPNEQHLFSARDRSQFKKTILVIDHYVPEYDQDAGSKSTFQYLKLFVEMGLNVKFIGDNFMRKEPYTQTLQQMGIEVLYGFEYASNWQQWVCNNAARIDYCLINRPHIAEKYIDFIKTNTRARVIFYGHDLHFLREERQYAVAPQKGLLKSAADWKKRELTLFHKSDVVVYPSPMEVKLIKEIDDTINVHRIQMNIYEKNSSGKRTTYNDDSRDLLFVGGFNHPPNADAVLWFANEILPTVLKSIPDCKFIVVGSKVPKEIASLASEHIIIKGFVSDEELEQLYDACRIVVAPLRYGAGIKGKIIEAIYHRKAVVTTNVGAEGLDISGGQIVVADEASVFANTLISLYNNKQQLTNMFNEAPVFIQKYFSPQQAIRFIESILTV